MKVIVRRREGGLIAVQVTSDSLLGLVHGRPMVAHGAEEVKEYVRSEAEFLGKVRAEANAVLRGAHEATRGGQ